MSQTQRVAVETFKTLHAEGCFVLPNPWDVGSAVYLQHLGFKALATTSAGFAFSKGLPDAPSVLSVDDVLEHIRDIVQSTLLPVNADFQNGYADSPDTVAENVTRCVDTGVAGLSIEDATGTSDTPLYDIQLAVERIKAARRAIDDTGIPVILDRKSTRLNSSHGYISYAVFCLKKKNAGNHRLPVLLPRPDGPVSGADYRERGRPLPLAPAAGQRLPHRGSVLLQLRRRIAPDRA